MNKLTLFYNLQDNFVFNNTTIYDFSQFSNAMNRSEKINFPFEFKNFVDTKLTFNLLLQNNDLTNNFNFYILLRQSLITNSIWLGKLPPGSPVVVHYMIFDKIQILANSKFFYNKSFNYNFSKDSKLFFGTDGTLTLLNDTLATNELENLITLEEIN